MATSGDTRNESRETSADVGMQPHDRSAHSTETEGVWNELLNATWKVPGMLSGILDGCDSTKGILFPSDEYQGESHGSDVRSSWKLEQNEAVFQDEMRYL